MGAYEDCIASTSAASAPWNIVPADDKKNSRLIISEIVINAFRELDLSDPRPTKARIDELKALRSLLESDED